MIQELTSTNFGTYFDVSSSNNQKNNVHHSQNNNSPGNTAHSTNQNCNQNTYLPQIVNNRQGRYPFDFEQRNDMSSMSAIIPAFDKCDPQQLLPRENNSYLNLEFNLKYEATKALNNFLMKKNENSSSKPSISPSNTGSSLGYPYQNRDIRSDPLPSPPHIDNMTSSDMSYSFRHPDLFFNSEKSKDNHYWDGHICSSSNNLVPKKEFKKVAHNVIERRYRNNINDRIQELKDNVPALYKAQISDGHLRSPVHNDHNDSDTEMIEGVEVAKKLNKATVLKKATEYIESLKRTQDKMSEENSILQNIISQMPNGPQVLSRFLYQKAELENAENQRLSKERQKAQEQARLDRKRVLRERAAERAALAQIIPKPERKPYKRRQQKKKSKDTHEFRGNRILMASFMCLVFFANLPVSIPPMICQNGKTSAGIEILSKIQYMTIYLTSELKIRAIFYSLISVFSILYMCLIPLVFCWLQPRPVKRVRSQLKLLCCFEEAMVAANCLCKTICNYVFYLFHKISFYSPIAYFGHEKERSTDKSYPNEESHFHVLNSNLGVITTSQMKQSGCKQNDLNNKKHHTILSSQLNLSPPPFLSTYFTQDCLKKIAGFPYKGWHIPKEDSTPANTQMAISRFKYHHFVSPNSVTNSHVPLLWQKIKE